MIGALKKAKKIDQFGQNFEKLAKIWLFLKIRKFLDLMDPGTILVQKPEFGQMVFSLNQYVA